MEVLTFCNSYFQNETLFKREMFSIGNFPPILSKPVLLAGKYSPILHSYDGASTITEMCWRPQYKQHIYLAQLCQLCKESTKKDKKNPNPLKLHFFVPSQRESNTTFSIS